MLKMLDVGIVYVLKLSVTKYTHQPKPPVTYPPAPELPFKVYVGTTTVDNYSERMRIHARGGGAEWTTLYPPFDVMRTIVCDDPAHVENNTTLEMMNLYGISAVRGGNWVQCTLPDTELISLVHLLDMTYKRCVECHQPGHFRKKCPLLQVVNISSHTTSSPVALSSSPIVSSQSNTPREVRHSSQLLSAAITQPMFVDAVPVTGAYRQISDSPVANPPIVTQRVDGGVKPLPLTRPPTAVNREASASGVWGMISSYLPNIGSMTTGRPAHASSGCSRCGYTNHTVDECYARTHIRGHSLTPKNAYGY